MERINKSEFLARLNVQESDLDKAITQARLHLVGLIEKRKQMFGARVSLEQLERDNLRVGFFDDGKTLTYIAQAKDQAGFQAPQ